MEITKNNRKWLDSLGLSHPVVIAGPCSAESEEQVLKTAHELKKTDTNIFRAGIWKPRTRPGGFEGVGEKGLPWLQKVREETGFKVTTEVGNADHVEKALKYDVDIFFGIGGGPEGVLAASALDAYNCNFQGRFIFETDEEKSRAKSMGISDLEKKYELNEIISGDSIFCATGITTGDLVSGIEVKDGEFFSETLITHKSSGLKKKIKIKQKI